MPSTFFPFLQLSADGPDKIPGVADRKMEGVWVSDSPCGGKSPAILRDNTDISKNCK